MAHTFATDRGDEQLIWDVSRLWELSRDLPVETVPLEDLVATLDENCWFGGNAMPTCREVADHARRIYETDLAYPIIVSADGEVMDGVHRVAKAWILSHEEVRIVRFSEDPEPDRRVPRQKNADSADPAASGREEGTPDALPMKELMRRATAIEYQVVGHFGAVDSGGQRYTWSAARTAEAVEGLLSLSEDRVARALAVLADRTRLLLLRALHHGPRSAAELSALLPPEAAGEVDSHLGELEKFGFIRRLVGRYQFRKRYEGVYLTALALAADMGAGAAE
jgi:DNA-binding transcriptional ArsR family regulator